MQALSAAWRIEESWRNNITGIENNDVKAVSNESERK